MTTKLPVVLTGKDNTTKPYVIDYGMSTSDPLPAHIEVTGFAIDLPTKVFTIWYSLGAYNAQGVFVPASGKPTARLSIYNTTARGAAFWTKYLEGRRTFDVDEIVTWLDDAGAVSWAAQKYWAIPELITDINPVVPPPNKPVTTRAAVPTKITAKQYISGGSGCCAPGCCPPQAGLAGPSGPTGGAK